MQDRASERIEFINLNGANDPTLFDLSKTGVCCRHDIKQDKGSILTIVINDLRVKARVVYCQERQPGFRLGMHFEEVTPEQQKSLGDLVDKFSRGVPISCMVQESK
jgi:PilZ domain